ncbi:hypothetical protein PPYR_12788 [Photinus pyralis]|uniref:Uncharacterized protein n=2 Tax=Photinus pyralis TaxID=7054 RepID=A0A5N4A7D4_PHOPY|nr:ankyrin repeat domain-containing protein 40-like [Photinus pyralis]KAB0793168.1 hypothetical protein PPYR_12788 [Photinus pyralis]
MENILEEKLREAACTGDTEALQSLIAQNIDINSQNVVNGWTALHWACKRGNEEIARILINSGADPTVENFKGETPDAVCSSSSIFNLLNIDKPVQNNFAPNEDNNLKFVPNYVKNPPLNGNIDLGPRLRTRHPDLSSMPTTILPAQNDDLVLKVRVAGSNDPDFIEIEIPRWKLTYSSLLHICCQELEIKETQVERIRKLPNTRLRKDSDVKRLNDLQCLEVVIKAPRDKYNNGYQSISVCKDQTILY